MDNQRINSASAPLFATFWRIYNENFPVHEKRSPDYMRTALSNDRCHLDVFTENGAVIGFIIYWHFADYNYVEFFAIDFSLQGGGYGSKIIKYLQDKSPQGIILEIEPVTDGKTEKRLRFYERLGFVMNDYPHTLPRYAENDHATHEKKVLSWPEAINKEMYDTFNSNLTDIVMKR